MLFGSLSLPPALLAVVWSLVVLFGGLGLIAVVSPRLFGKLSHVGNRWIDTSRFFAKLDRPIDVDARLAPHARRIGAAVVVSVGVLALTLLR